MPKLCVTLTRPESIKWPVDLVELRVDHLGLEQTKQWIKSVDLPVLLTLRSKRHGGAFCGGVEEQVQALQQLAALCPPFLDIEWGLRNRVDVPEGVRVVVSYHTENPNTDAQTVFEQMQNEPADLYKIVAPVDCTTTALERIVWSQKYDNLLMISLGEEGLASRVICPFSFATPEIPVAPGQLTVDELIDRYRYQEHHRERKILGIIGDPLTLSPGKVVHNRILAQRGVDAVYLPFKVTAGELEEFMQVIRNFPLGGLSVTMPLKEAVMKYLDQIDPKAAHIGSVNTVVTEGHKLVGYNTDGVGALQALGPVDGQQMVVLGAGGAGRAIAAEAVARGAEVTLLNRTVRRAQVVAERLGCQWGSLDELSKIDYDILVQATSIELREIRPNKTLLEVINTTTPLVEKARSLGCRVVLGSDMWRYQAAEQLKLWYGWDDVEELVDDKMACISY